MYILIYTLYINNKRRLIQVQTIKLSDEGQNYVTQIAPVGDIILQEVDHNDDGDDGDDNQNNYHQELSNNVIKFNSLPPPSTYRNIDRHSSRQRHHTAPVHTTSNGSNKWMDRLMGHKRWGKLKIEK